MAYSVFKREHRGEEHRGEEHRGEEHRLTMAYSVFNPPLFKNDRSIHLSYFLFCFALLMLLLYYIIFF